VDVRVLAGDFAAPHLHPVPVLLQIPGSLGACLVADLYVIDDAAGACRFGQAGSGAFMLDDIRAPSMVATPPCTRTVKLLVEILDFANRCRMEASICASGAAAAGPPFRECFAVLLWAARGRKQIRISAIAEKVRFKAGSSSN